MPRAVAAAGGRCELYGPGQTDEAWINGSGSAWRPLAGVPARQPGAQYQVPFAGRVGIDGTWYRDGSGSVLKLSHYHRGLVGRSCPSPRRHHHAARRCPHDEPVSFGSLSSCSASTAPGWPVPAALANSAIA
jgi:hypothetical protein